MSKWVIRNVKANTALMSKSLGISEITAQLLVNRGVLTKDDAMRYLFPEMKYMRDSFLMKDFKKAVSIVLESLSVNDRIIIFGDYDVDGVMSTAILYKALKNIGANVSYYIPHREGEGYGLNSSAVKKIREAEFDLIITCDNGISALNEVLEAKNLGMKIVIIDHHEPGFVEDDGGRRDVLPHADAVVDPKQQACGYQFKNLCAAGICYKFAIALISSAGKKSAISDELLVLAAIATFCDIVSLRDENRILAKNGLDIINRNKSINLGLQKLMSIKNILTKKISGFDIGFIIGPCINASGRLSNAASAVELIVTDDPDKAELLAQELSELNDSRKNMTAKAVESVMLKLAEQCGEKDKVVVVYDDTVHESIAGIAAGRVKELLHRPVIVLTKAEDMIKGSARSIESYNIFDELYKNRDLFERFGGHSMAAGLSLNEVNINELRNRLNSSCKLTDDDLVETIRVDMQLSLSDATYMLAEELNRLAPFGSDNKEPLFGSKGVLAEEIRMIEDKNTLIFSFKTEDSYRRMKGICFGLCEKLRNELSRIYGDKELKLASNGNLANIRLMLDIVYAVEINEYNGSVSVQLKIKDFRASE